MVRLDRYLTTFKAGGVSAIHAGGIDEFATDRVYRLIEWLSYLTKKFFSA